MPLMHRCSYGTGRNQPARKWRMVSAMRSDSWVRSSAPPFCLVAAFHHSDVPFLIGTVTFSTTMLLVYLASTLFHGWPQTKTKSLLQVIDHAAIFLLIAGR